MTEADKPEARDTGYPCQLAVDTAIEAVGYRLRRGTLNYEDNAVILRAAYLRAESDRDAAQEECRMMQERLQRLIDKKLIVPMAMLRECANVWEDGHMMTGGLSKIASKYGYDVTE